MPSDKIKIPKFKLKKTTPLTNMGGDDIWIPIKKNYGHASILVKIANSIINSVLTEGKPVFFLSRKIATNVINDDENLERSSINGKEFRLVVELLTSTGFMTVLKKQSKSRNGWHSPVFEVRDPTALKFLKKKNEFDIVLLREQAVDAVRQNEAQNPKISSHLTNLVTSLPTNLLTSHLTTPFSTGTPYGVLEERTAESASGFLADSPSKEKKENSGSVVQNFIRKTFKLYTPEEEAEALARIEAHNKLLYETPTPKDPNGDIFQKLGIP